MKADLTELVFILDRSGSMAHLTEDTIGGFNSLIEKQKQEEGEAYVSTVLFNSSSSVLHDRVPLDRVEPMTRRDYCACGSTALLDAVGDAIHHIGNVHKYARPEDVPAHTMVIITTDGMENSSTRYTADQIRALISRQKEKYGWEFLFLGANIDAVETARHYGISQDRAVTYKADSAGTRLNFRAMSEAVRAFRSCQPISASWKEEIEEDVRKRGRK